MPSTTRITACLSLLALVAPGEAAAGSFVASKTVVLSNPNEHGRSSDVWGFVGSNGREYVIQGVETGTVWYDVDDPANPIEVRFLPGPTSNWRDMFVIGDYAYVGTEGGGGIQIVDVSDPTLPLPAGTYTATVTNSHNIFGDPARDLLFVVGSQAIGNGPLQILDVSSPTSPVQIGVYSAGGYVHDVSIEGTVAHLNHINEGTVEIVDLTDPTLPASLGTFFDPTGRSHSSWPLGDGVHLAVCEEILGGHVKILDVSDPGSIGLAATYAPFPLDTAHNPHAAGGHLYVAWNRQGTRILDVSSPSIPVEVAYLDTSPPEDDAGIFSGNWGTFPHLPSGLIASTDRLRGLFLFEHVPDAGVLRGTVSASGGGPLASATVTHDDLGLIEVTPSDGSFAFSVFPGASQTVRADAYAYLPDSVTVNVDPSDTTTVALSLELGPHGSVTGTVTDAQTGLPLPGAELRMPGVPIPDVATDSTGTYTFPIVEPGTYNVRVMRYGYHRPGPEQVTVTDGGVATLSFELPPAAVLVDFSDPTGWTVEDEFPLWGGSWEIASPAETELFGPFQTGADHTVGPDNQCAVTGAGGGAANDDDVDGGPTKLFSPHWDLSDMTDPRIFYWRWYAVVPDHGESFEVKLGTDGGSTYPIVVDQTDVRESYWKFVQIRLDQYISDFSSVGLLFAARDLGTDQPVEAALDDLTIYDAALGPVHVPGGHDAAHFTLAPGAPNPFRTVTEIRFEVPAATSAEISVFDVTGRRVARLLDRRLEEGEHTIRWHGLDDAGRRVGAGVYWYRLVTPEGSRSRRVVVLR